MLKIEGNLGENQFEAYLNTTYLTYAESGTYTDYSQNAMQPLDPKTGIVLPRT